MKININKLRPEALSATGEQVYGLEEFIYIKSFSYDDNNSIKVSFYRLLKTSETEFDLIADISKAEFSYSIADGKSFVDKDGFNVYVKDEDGDVIYEDVVTEQTDEEGNVTEVVISTPKKRDIDFTRNFVGFSQMIIPSIFADVKNYLGYHNNGGGAVDNVE